MINRENHAISSEMPPSKKNRHWILLSAAAVTFVFVLAYQSMIHHTPDISAVSMFYVICGGLLWTISKLIKRVQRVKQ